MAVNLDPSNEQAATINLDMGKLGLPWQGPFIVEDLLTGTRYNWHDQWNYVALKPTATAHIFRIVNL